MLIRSKGMLKFHLIACYALILGAATVSGAPEWIKQLGPDKPGNHPPLPAGKLEFDLSWKGLLNSGELTFDVGKPGAHKPGVIVIRSSGKSMGPGGSIFPYNGHSWSEINSGSLRPRFLTATEFKRGEQIETVNRFFSDRVAYREISKNKKKQHIESHVFGQSPVYDIGSTILFLRSQKLDNGDEIKLMMHPYSSPYLLTAKVLGREKHNDIDCIKLSLELSKINHEKMTLKPYKKLKEPALLWFSDDKKRLPLEIRSEVFIGDVRATLRGFKEA